MTSNPVSELGTGQSEQAVLVIDSKEIRVAIGSNHITPAVGNIFLDLGFPPAEAARLKAASQKAVEIRCSFLEALASMPNVGEDADFTRA